MAKDAWGVARYESGGVPEILETFADRMKCMAALIKKREGVPETERWKFLMLPLDNKGRGLLPPGVR